MDSFLFSWSQKRNCSSRLSVSLFQIRQLDSDLPNFRSTAWWSLQQWGRDAHHSGQRGWLTWLQSCNESRCQTIACGLILPIQQNSPILKTTKISVWFSGVPVQPFDFIISLAKFLALLTWSIPGGYPPGCRSGCRLNSLVGWKPWSSSRLRGSLGQWQMRVMMKGFPNLKHVIILVVDWNPGWGVDPTKSPTFISILRSLEEKRFTGHQKCLGRNLCRFHGGVPRLRREFALQTTTQVPMASKCLVGSKCQSCQSNVQYVSPVKETWL